MLKKTFFIFFPLGLPVATVYAQATNTAPPIKSVADLIHFFDYLARFFYTIFLIVAVIMFVYSAFIFLTASGDDSKIQKARDSIIWGAIAMAVAILAFSMSTFVTALLQKRG